MGCYYVIGAGPLGISLAYELSEQGLKVQLIDEGKSLGGLASYQLFDGMWVDKYYHFYYWNDHQIAEKFLKKTKTPYHITWKEISSSTYSDGLFFNFDNAYEVFKLAKTNFIKVLSTLLKLKFFQVPLKLDQVSAIDWSNQAFGRKFAQAVWIPLLQDKFGVKAKAVSAYWLATRVKRHLSTKVGFPPKCRFGYLDSTYKLAFDYVIQQVVEKGGQYRPQLKLKNLNIADNRIQSLGFQDNQSIEIQKQDTVISTVPLAALKNSLKQIPSELEYLNQFDASGVILLILSLKKKLSDDYWTTVTDRSIPFKVVIQQNRLLPKGEAEVVYLSKYFYQSSESASENKEMIFQEFWQGLKKMFPDLKDSDLNAYEVNISRTAAPIPYIGSLHSLPPFKSKIENFYHAGFEHIYPEDRGVGNSIQVGQQMAQLILHDKGKNV